MSVSVSEYTDLLNDRTYARFIQTNLHMHTPVTAWDWNAYQHQTVKADQITPETYFEALNQTDLELVAITDHNCVDWCEPLIELAKDSRRQASSRLHILPGVEITSYEGPHLIALFDENYPVKEIRDFLTRLKLSGNGVETDRVHNEITISHILREIDDMGGIAVGPHVHSKDGLWGSKDFRGRTDVLNDWRLRILAAPSSSIKRVTDRDLYSRFLYKHMDSDVIQNAFAFINISDCHRLDDFELNTTWLKMCNPSLEGVRQVIYEPELRVSCEVVDTGQPFKYPYAMNFCSPITPTHSHIIGVAVTGGMLNGQQVAFSPHQNCIIGKNYAGKSAILDCIRFVLNILPSNDNAERLFVDRLRAIITEGGQVRLYVADDNGKIFGISRTLLVTNAGTKNNQKWKLDSKAEIYYLFEKQFHRDSSSQISDIFHAETYPQGEVVKIKDNVAQQMSIVDSLARLRERIERLGTENLDGEATLYGELISNSQELVRLTKRSEKIEEQLLAVPDLEAEIATLEKLAGSPLLKEVQQWTEIEEKIKRLRKSSQDTKKKVSALTQGADNQPETEKDSSDQLTVEAIDFSIATPDEISKELEHRDSLVLQEVSEALRGSVTLIDNFVTSLDDIENVVNKRSAKAKEEVENQSDNTSITELTERITAKKRRLDSLQNMITEREQLQEDLKLRQTQRTEMKAHYLKEWQDIRAERRRIVELINQDSADNIEAELVENADISNYLELLNDIARRLSSSTNRFSNYGHLEFIAENTTPQHLVEIICGGDANKLVDVAEGVSLNNARLLISMGLEDIHKLDLCVLGDKFEIRLRKEGDDNFTPVGGGLSGGEQALALISVAMIPKDRPLVIDQPEDELGPALITGELVEQIRRVKPKRQLVFVTHIPNIPVLADSEQIIYVEQEISPEKKQTRIKYCGSLDNLQVVRKLLELDGGEIAFDKRQKRYSRVMS